MAIVSKAGQTTFYNLNASRSANSPIQFPNMSPTAQFSFCIWARANGTIPETLFTFYGNEGSYFNIIHNGVHWYLISQQGTVAQPTQFIGDVQVGVWAAWGVVKSGGYLNFYLGTEDLTVPNPQNNPVVLKYIQAFPVNLNFPTAYVGTACNADLAICNYKFWNTALTQAQMQEQINRWDASPGTSGGAAPMWVSTFRTPSDTASIVNPFAGSLWAQEHATSYIVPGSSNLTMYPADPEYLANHQLCPTWVYPVGYIIPEYLYQPVAGSVITDSWYNPGVTPLVPTTYQAPQFFQFDDRGSVPAINLQVYTIDHLGGVTTSGPGPGPSDTWGLYQDDKGVTVLPAQIPANRLDPQTPVPVPGGINALTMYLWKFGAQFTYQPLPSQPVTAVGYLFDIRLFVIYLGYPTGVPQIHAGDTSGLFIITPGSLTDVYNNGYELKIPDPTIKTAYIGE